LGHVSSDGGPKTLGRGQGANQSIIKRQLNRGALIEHSLKELKIILKWLKAAIWEG